MYLIRKGNEAVASADLENLIQHFNISESDYLSAVNSKVKRNKLYDWCKVKVFPVILKDGTLIEKIKTIK